jgi:hypothetical protein
MTADLNRVLSELSRDELERLLAAKSEIERLEARRQELREELDTVEQALDRLVHQATKTRQGGDRSGASTARQAAGKGSRKTGKGSRKTAGKKTARKAASKAASKKAGGGKAAAKKTSRRSARPARGRGTAGDGGTLEDVIVRVLQEHGEPMSFKALLESIVMNKLFVSRSKNFDNVLRRTLSTSDRVKRVARGVYAV